jgi:hypothetical protein
MLTLTKNELKVFQEIQSEVLVILIETEHQNATWWRMKIDLPEQNKEFYVVTALGKTKLWRHLDIAIEFVRALCPKITSVQLQWTPTSNQ